MRLALPAFVAVGAVVEPSDLPPDTTLLVATNARGETVTASLDEEGLTAGLPAGTWQVEAIDGSGARLAEELVTVGAHPAERPVHAFVTSFGTGEAGQTVEWLTSLRATVVQFYDWMASYCAPVGKGTLWEDPSHRPVERAVLEELAAAVRASGGIALAYAPVYATDLGYAAEHREQMLYRGDGEQQRLFDNIRLANPADARWQQQFVAAYGTAADQLGFNGFHVDTYGFPRAALDAQGSPVDMLRAYEDFLEVLRARRPGDTICFNQVDGAPSALRLPAEPSIRYCELWPPNDSWRHLEAFLDRTSGRAGHLAGRAAEASIRGSLACYPPVWGSRDEPLADEARPNALRTVVCTEAIATMLAASLLVHGDQRAVLSDAYYPQHERLTVSEAAAVLDWHLFALRCRDLFIEGEDTSWYEIRDDNGAVSVAWDGAVSPEPVGGAVFVRVVSRDDYLAVGVLDLSGSTGGRWNDLTAPGSCHGVTVRVLRDRPERWEAAGAVLGDGDGRFAPLPATVVTHREGLALEAELPIVSGWSVLRLVLRRK